MKLLYRVLETILEYTEQTHKLLETSETIRDCSGELDHIGIYAIDVETVMTLEHSVSMEQMYMYMYTETTRDSRD